MSWINKLIEFQRYYERTGKKVKVEKKFFKIIEDKDLDVLVVATPDHWHAYSACKAMEYGKHVYLENHVVIICLKMKCL